MSKLKRIILKDISGRMNSHPWIHKNHIASADPDVNAGDIVAVITRDNICLGTGYYNPRSVIAIRMLSREEEAIDKIVAIEFRINNHELRLKSLELRVKNLELNS